MRAVQVVTVLASFSGAAAFFQSPNTPSRIAPVQADASTSPSGVEMSPAIPFLPRPMNLKGMTGDVGFDPLGISELGIPADWLRESEIKHARVCMLAFVGYVTTDLGIKLPGEIHQISSLQAHDAGVAWGGMTQILFWLLALEAISFVGILEMLTGSGRKPGDFGFDPLQFSKSSKKEYFELAELQNGRLAMLAISGVITQDAAFPDKGFPYF